MAYALSPSVSIARDPVRERTALIIVLSVLLHGALGWGIINLLVVRTLPEPEPPMTIEIAPPYVPPAPAAPSVTPDAPSALPEKPRSELAPPKPETPDTPRQPAAPSNPSAAAQPGPVDAMPGYGREPAAAPRPTYRADVSYPARARNAERNGVAVVEVLIDATGGVSDIRLIDETPGGYGFGEAAVSSVRQWRFETAQPGVYRVTVRFKLN